MTTISKVQAAYTRMSLAFQTPSFRWLWLSAIFGAMGHAANSLSMGWLVLETTDSAFWVGAVSAMLGIGELLFGVFAGVLLDRYDKRIMLMMGQFIGAFMPIIIGVLVLTDEIALWHLFVLNLFTGMITSIRAPAFNTMTFQLVGPKRILNATATTTLGFNLAGIFGPPVAGVAIDQFGQSSGFFLSSMFSFLAVGSVWFVIGNFRTESESEPILRAAVSGIRYVWSHLKLRKLLTLSVIGETFGFSFLVMLPVVARDVLGLDATGLGVLSAARGSGAAVATLGVASLGDYARKGWLLVVAMTGAGVSMILFGLSSWYVISLVLVAILGAMMTIYDVTMKSLVLMLAGDAWRGRVQSIYTLTYAFVSIGGFLAGSIASLVGVSLTLVLNGSVMATFINTFGRIFRTMTERDDSADLANTPP